jgi:ParB family chromosome partitioning protein
LIDEINLTQEELSSKIGKKRSTISNYLRLLKLNPIIQSGIKDGFISMGHGRAMINIEDKNLQLNIYEKIISKNLSVRNTEKLIQSFKKSKNQKKDDKSKIPNQSLKGILKLEKKISRKIKVSINNDESGKIIIPFGSIKDLNFLNKKINE